MDNPGDILISVENRHALSMLAGNKSVELRRKPLNISSGTRVWIYSKVPCGQIRALAVVDEVVADTPKNIGNYMAHKARYLRPSSMLITISPRSDTL